MGALGAGAYIFISRQKAAEAPAPQQTTNELPKAKLQEYFGVDTCNQPSTCGGTADPDEDGLANYDEFVAGTNPTKPDSDSDGLADGDELHVYKTDPNLQFTDTRAVVSENGWLDSIQIKGGYDPLTPGLKLTDTRLQQIGNDSNQYGLHEPTLTSLGITIKTETDTTQ